MPTLDIFGYNLEINQIVNIMRENQKSRQEDVVSVQEMEHGKRWGYGYWVFHIGNDYEIYKITDPYAHWETAFAVIGELEIDAAYEDFIKQGITRVFGSGCEMSIHCGKNYLDDALFICAMTPQEYTRFSIAVYDQRNENDEYIPRDIKISRDELMEMF